MMKKAFKALAVIGAVAVLPGAGLVAAACLADGLRRWRVRRQIAALVPLAMPPVAREGTWRHYRPC